MTALLVAVVLAYVVGRALLALLESHRFACPAVRCDGRPCRDEGAS